jgi:hypothetical protein
MDLKRRQFFQSRMVRRDSSIDLPPKFDNNNIIIPSASDSQQLERNPSKIGASHNGETISDREPHHGNLKSKRTLAGPTPFQLENQTRKRPLSYHLIMYGFVLPLRASVVLFPLAFFYLILHESQLITPLFNLENLIPSFWLARLPFMLYLGLETCFSFYYLHLKIKFSAPNKSMPRIDSDDLDDKAGSHRHPPLYRSSTVEFVSRIMKDTPSFKKPIADVRTLL